MLPLNDQRRELNHQWWEKKGRVVLEDYSIRCSEKSFEEEKTSFRSLTAYAESYVTYAFDFMMTGRQVEASQAAERAIHGANEALRSESFDQIFIDEVRFTSPYKEMERCIGFMNALRWLHYATWFSTGERPLKMLSEAATYHREYYGLLRGSRDSLLEQLMLDYLEAEQFTQAIELWERDGKQTTSLTKHLSRSPVRTLAALAKVASSDEEYRQPAQKAVDAWCEHSKLWTMNDANLPWHRRLSWAYLQGRNFTEKIDLDSLILELRGF